MSDLLAATAALVAVPSLSTEEGLIADHVEALLRRHAWLDVVRVGDNVVARTDLGLPDRVVLAGHLDTVPPNGNAVPKIDGTTLWGLGSTDMKGGLAVMIDLAASVRGPNCDLTFVFYVAEEIAREHNGLLALASAKPGLLDASAAIVCEPTNCRVEAGCQGVLKADVAMAGRRAHVARPWTGRNAIHRLAPLLAGVVGWPGREVQIDGCTYIESLQAVGVSGGVASNVLPDSAVLQLNYRFAPDRDVAAASEALREIVAPWLEDGDIFTVANSAPSAPPSLSHPFLARLVSTASGPVSGKLGWTDVAFFAERGIPAANFGPGDPELAHTAGEMVTRASLDEARAVLGRLLGE
ncbi:MAG TPA: succinyl-diaminopimelate desuccinylase [Acidimicrobiales bacterium]|nr:succinyl-diaminopimelate desuccinylase [Acidimicrobiales bacterium]